ncbi:unnamed protein product [Phyllotreta striolata]|uniref:Uncharacterized protein n=1 Tax=Phyllotreta striolata TaxID=444603 RepID=A0A9N9TFR0_PHYSR|nr:unnamed protein product [Phyllotreta striolata]
MFISSLRQQMKAIKVIIHVFFRASKNEREFFIQFYSSFYRQLYRFMMENASLGESDVNLTDEIITEHLTEAEIAYEICQLVGARSCRRAVKTALKMDNLINIEKKTYADLLSLPKKHYLECTLVPILINGITHVAQERPPCPIKTLAVFLLKNKNFYETDAEIEAESKPSANVAKSRSKIAAFVSRLSTRT